MPEAAAGRRTVRRCQVDYKDRISPITFEFSPSPAVLLHGMNLARSPSEMSRPQSRSTQGNEKEGWPGSVSGNAGVRNSTLAPFTCTHDSAAPVPASH